MCLLGCHAPCLNFRSFLFICLPLLPFLFHGIVFLTISLNVFVLHDNIVNCTKLQIAEHTSWHHTSHIHDNIANGRHLRRGTTYEDYMAIIILSKFQYQHIRAGTSHVTYMPKLQMVPTIPCRHLRLGTTHAIYMTHPYHRHDSIASGTNR